MTNPKKLTKLNTPEEAAEAVVQELIASGWVPVQTSSVVAWQAGQREVGAFVELRDSSFIGDDGVPAKQLVLLQDDGIELVLRCPAVLQRKLIGVEPGTELLVECLGKVRTRAGRQAWDFVVMKKSS